MMYNFQSKILEMGGSEKNDCLGGLKELLPRRIFAWGLAMFLK